jgi:hypothetical protein
MSGLKRPLSEIETELDEAVRLEAETKGHIKRLCVERDTHEEYIARMRHVERAWLAARLPPYLYEALVRTPIDPESYGALRGYSIKNGRHINDDLLKIKVVFEKKTIKYELDDSLSRERPSINMPTEPPTTGWTMTQEAFWNKALELNNGDVGLALIVLCRDCYRRVAYFEDKNVKAPLYELDVLRSIQCKLPHVTADDMRKLCALEMFSWLAKFQCDYSEEQVRRINASRYLFSTTLYMETKH